jgi:hypothetical protein
MSVLDDAIQEIESAGRSLVGFLLKEVDGFKHYLAIDLSAVGGGGVSHVVIPPTPDEAAIISAATQPSQATLDQLVAAVMAKLQGGDQVKAAEAAEDAPPVAPPPVAPPPMVTASGFPLAPATVAPDIPSSGSTTP